MVIVNIIVIKKDIYQATRYRIVKGKLANICDGVFNIPNFISDMRYYLRLQPTIIWLNEMSFVASRVFVDHAFQSG